MIYTKKGDSGKSLISGKSYEKCCVEIDALGELDELNSLLGLVKNNVKPHKQILSNIQNDLFIIQAVIASKSFNLRLPAPNFKKEKIWYLEKEIKKVEKNLRPITTFIIPGSNYTSAFFDYARAVARRCERSVIKFNKKRKVGGNVLAYINRLSSLLYVLARVEDKGKETFPKYN